MMEMQAMDTTVRMLDGSIEPARRIAAWGSPEPLQRLLEAGDAMERRAQVRGMLEALGFKWLGYSSLRQQGDHVDGGVFYAGHTDPDWARLYFAEGFQRIDPRLQLALASSLPVIWSLDDLAAQAAPGTPAGSLQRLLNGLERTNTHSGVMMLVGGGGPQERRFIGLSSSRRGKDWIDGPLLGQAVTLGLCVHEYYTRYAPQPTELTESELSPTQQAILRCLSGGMADKAISACLALSAHNVDYHLRQLRKRFGVRNRLQLVQAATAFDSTM
jgi:DNA-binding CsgD family transcriptional regulator